MNQITTGAQTVSAAGAVTGSLDTSAITADFTAKVRVRGLAATKRILLALEDTVDGGTPFADARQVAVFDVLGGGVDHEISLSRSKYEMPSIRVGVANAKLRLRALSIDGSASASVQAWLE